MGSSFEVWLWARRGTSQEYGYGATPAYSCDRLIPALWFAWQAKRRGIGCVRLEWR